MTPDSRTAAVGPRLLFLGYAVDDERIRDICARDRVAPIQTHRFTWRLIRGIEQALGNSIELASFAPVSDYPTFPEIVIRRRSWTRSGNMEAAELPFINLLGAKHITRFVVALRFLLSWAARGRGVQSLVVNYSVATSQLYACLVARMLSSVKIVNIITDAPGIPNGKESVVVSTLRRIDVALARFALGRLDGIVALTRDLEYEFAPGRPCLIVEGMVDPCWSTLDVPAMSEAESREECFVVTYAGNLAANSGVDSLLQAFAQIPDPSVRLWIFGKGILSGQVVEAAKADSRIEYFGFVSDVDLESRMSASSVLVVPRPVADIASRFVFPSKLMDYLIACRPVAATEAAGIPREYFDHIYSLGSGTTADIKAGLLRVRASSYDDRMGQARYAREYVCRAKNYIVQGERIVNFLRETTCNTANAC